MCTCAHTYTHAYPTANKQLQHLSGFLLSEVPLGYALRVSLHALFLIPAASLVLCLPLGKFQFLIRFSKQGPWALIQLPPQSYYIEHVPDRHL